MAVRIRPIDWSSAGDTEGYLNVLNDYASDPMGRNCALTADVVRRLPGALAENDRCHVLVAEATDGIVGVATCFVGFSTFQARAILNIHDIAVLAQSRGRGIGRSLLDAIESLGRRLECCRITLEVRADNPTARALYARSGFMPASCEIFMEKPL